MRRIIQIFFFLFFAVTVHAQDPQWNFLNYDDGYKNYRGGNYGLTINGDTLATVYFTRNENQVRYCFSTDGGTHWQTEIIEDSSAVFYDDLNLLRQPSDSAATHYRGYGRPLLTFTSSPYGVDFLMDAAGIPHLLFVATYAIENRNSYRQWLKHAWRENGKWKSELIAQAIYPNPFHGELSMIVEPSGVIDILFSQDKAGMQFARREGGAWKIHPVDTMAYGVSLQMDKSGAFHCIMGEVNQNAMYLVSRDKGKTWSKEVLPQCTWWEVDLAVSSTGVPHIVFKDLREGMMHSVRKKNGEWETTVLFAEHPVYSARPEIMIDACDQIHVCFFSGYSDVDKPDELFYTCSTDGGKNWELSSVDPIAHNGSSSGMPGMCISGGNIYFSYYLQDYSPRIAWAEIDCGPRDPVHGKRKR
jgi:hypothetical protein